jgi:1-acyl-sn-glycerol-3-phosphate acyltransferase
MLNKLTVKFAQLSILGLVKLLVGATPRWVNAAPNNAQCIYFTNHSSHLDTLALWTALPKEIRAKSRPVAAKDYWGKGLVKQFIALKVLNCVLIDREFSRYENPLQPLFVALQNGDSLIIFPEGTRRAQAEPSEFKGGLFHLAEAFPEVKLIPVYLDTLHRSMPKGAILPVPLICTVRCGGAIGWQVNEHIKDCLARAREAVLALM